MSQTITSTGAICYRTKLMELARAAAFARCIGGNTDRFADVTIEESGRARSDAKFFVQFRPISRERQEALYGAQFDLRTQRAEAEGADYIFWQDDSRRFWWCFNPKSGETYEVSAGGCTCPDHEFRCKRAGLQCKHVQALGMQAEAGTLGKTDKVTRTPEAEARRQRVLANIARDF